MGVFESNNVTINNCIIADVMKRPEMVMHNTVDKESCLSMCAYFNAKDTACYQNKVTNNVAAGCEYAAFVVPGHDCDDSANSLKFKGNVGHSTAGSGANIFPDVNGNSHEKCYEGSYFTGYKN